VERSASSEIAAAGCASLAMTPYLFELRGRQGRGGLLSAACGALAMT